jgi:hypothetical protein
MLANHFGAGTKLFVPSPAKSAFTARDEVMNANPVARFEPPNRGTNFVHDPRNLVSKGKRQQRDWRHPGAIMGIRMANASGTDANQNIARAQTGNLDPRLFETRTDRR